MTNQLSTRLAQAAQEAKYYEKKLEQLTFCANVLLDALERADINMLSTSNICADVCAIKQLRKALGRVKKKAA
ncbi:protein of unknown function [uncultured Woeseiaceae bacterium]|uniref:Uncharacterized protein n=1 Tax=uncultured Woeseiaceae bacterium TaxID=1983305 RepID=A0A7D9D2W4_9GAMM|nr:protein of unknown function [uncultured Woeseiaceae bacterium]